MALFVVFVEEKVLNFFLKVLAVCPQNVQSTVELIRQASMDKIA
jgi:hypothetical protein